jgi:uncharacterized protein with HEPN domain
VSRAAFDDDDLPLAVLHRLQVVAGAASRVNPQQCEVHADLPWRNIIGMRHVVVHDYLRVDLDVAWNTAQTDVPGRIASLRSLSPRPDASEAEAE